MTITGVGQKELKMMERHSILPGKCYRDSFGVTYKVVSFDGNEVQCILYDRTERGGAHGKLGALG